MTYEHILSHKKNSNYCKKLSHRFVKNSENLNSFGVIFSFFLSKMDCILERAQKFLFELSLV